MIQEIKESSIKKVLLEISIDDKGNLEWKFSPDLTTYQLYGMLGLIEIIKDELKEDLKQDFQTPP